MESVFQVWKMLFATSVFLVFFVWDLVMACQRGDPWVQGSALTLTALTVQFLGYFDAQNVDLFGKPSEAELQTLLDKQLSLDVARLVFCTFLGCVLPSVAFHSSGGRWANIAALSVSLCLHIGTEVHALQNVHDPILRSGRGEDFIWSSVLLLVAAISLVLYLGLAVVNCKYSRDRLNFKISTMLSGWVQSEIKPDIKENEVFKWWVVVRACHQEFWLRSSAFTPAVLMIVTTCVAVVMGKLISRQSILRHSNTGVILTLCLQCAFIVTGWIILIWRWLIFLLFCTSREGDPLKSFVPNIYVHTKCFSRLVELIIKNLMTLDKVSPSKCIPTCVWKALRKLVFFIYVMILLLKQLLFLVFVFHQYFNYMCWFLWMGLILLFLRVRRFLRCLLDFSSIADEKLESPGTEETIYVPVSSVEETRKAKDKAYSDGKGYYENLKSKKCLVDIETSSSEVIRNEISQNKDKYKYQGVWTMAAVAAISIIAELAYGRDWSEIVKNAVNVYRGAQDLLNFIDFPDNITVNSINFFVSGNGRAYQMSLEADIKMQEIEKLIDETSYPKTTLKFEDIAEVVRAFALAKGNSPDLKDRQPKDMLRNFCQYWTVKTHWSNKESAHVLKSLSMKCVCKAIFNESCSTKKELFDRAVSCLGDIIACAALQLHLVVLPQYCRKWAEEFNEENLIRALEIHERVRAIAEGLTSADTDKLPEDIIASGIAHLQQVLTQQYGKSTEEFKQKNLLKALAIQEKFNAIEDMLVSEDRQRNKDLVYRLEFLKATVEYFLPDRVPAKGFDENKLGEDSNVDVKETETGDRERDGAERDIGCEIIDFEAR